MSAARWTLSSSGALAILLLGLLSLAESVVVVCLYPSFRPVVSAGGFVGGFYGLYLAVGLLMAACISGLERNLAGRARLADAAGPLVLGAAAIAYGFPTWRAIFVVNLVSATRPIPPGPSVAVDLAAHSGRRPAKTTRDRPIRGSRSQSPRDLLAFS